MDLTDDDYNELECSIFEVLDDCYENDIEYEIEDIVDLFYGDISSIVSSDSLRDVIKECIYSYYEIFYDITLVDDDDDTVSLTSSIEDPIVSLTSSIEDPIVSLTSSIEDPIVSLTSPLELQTEWLMDKLNKLREVYQPEQRTEEWYLFRQGLITASTVWKIFKSQASLNSLIYEKCSPTTKQLSSHSLEWGKKYEPISVALYEKRFSTKVGEFGCITHPQYPFLGASPDGINIDPHSSKWGTMIEVKNIVNRFITGKPKEEYWIQMQIQMEVCDLDHCDFIETRFKEYENKSLFKADDAREKGIIFIGYFLDDNTPHYVYLDQIDDEWIRSTIESHQYGYHHVVYWYLDEFSCIPIERNRLWFQEGLPKIKGAWDLICEEKKTGYQHRKPISRNNKQQDIPHPDLFESDDIVLGNTVKVIKLGDPCDP
jgi:putative phage-type endonuclease